MSKKLGRYTEYSSVISTVGDLSRWRLSAAGVYVTRLEIQVCPALWLSPNLPLLKHFPSTLVTHQPWKHIYSLPSTSNSVRGAIED